MCPQCMSAINDSSCQRGFVPGRERLSTHGISTGEWILIFPIIVPCMTYLFLVNGTEEDGRSLRKRKPYVIPMIRLRNTDDYVICFTTQTSAVLSLGKKSTIVVVVVSLLSLFTIYHVAEALATVPDAWEDGEENRNDDIRNAQEDGQWRRGFEQLLPLR